MTNVSISTEYRDLVRAEFAEVPDDEFDRLLRAVCRFLELSSRHPTGRFIPLNRAADDVWHEMIVQTRHYFAFCEALPGHIYLHHEAIGMEDYIEKVGLETAVREFIGWIPDYTSRYGPFDEKDSRIWAVVDFLITEVGLTLDEVNALEREPATA